MLTRVTVPMGDGDEISVAFNGGRADGVRLQGPAQLALETAGGPA
jgi:hypothetical protein